MEDLRSVVDEVTGILIAFVDADGSGCRMIGIVGVTGCLMVTGMFSSDGSSEISEN